MKTCQLNKCRKQTCLECGQLLIKQVLHNSGLKLPAHLLYTDQIFASVPWICVKTIRFMNKAVYCYRIGRDGQSVSRESRIKHCSDSVEVNKALIRFYESDQNAKECTASEYIVRRISMYSIEVLRTFMLGEVSRENCKKVRDYDNYVKENLLIFIRPVAS